LTTNYLQVILLSLKMTSLKSHTIIIPSLFSKKSKNDLVFDKSIKLTDKSNVAADILVNLWNTGFYFCIVPSKISRDKRSELYFDSKNYLQMVIICFQIYDNF
jgi:hypothetical protein